MKRTLFSIISLVAVATLTGCALFYPNLGSNETPSDPMNPSPSVSESEVEQSPTSSPSPTATKQPASPRITFYEISGTDLVIIGEVTNFAEDGGECIYTFYSGNTPIVLERVPAEHNVTTTQCFPLNVSLSRLPKGIVEATVGYESEMYEGVSPRSEVIIP